MKNLKGILAAVTMVVVLGGSHSAQATISLTPFSNWGSGTLYTGSGSGSQVIPDNTPAGVAYSVNFGATGLSINNISVSLQLSGGYNSDIYAYLSHGSQIAVLLNQITGTAGNGSGFNVTLVEGTSNPIQTASGTAGAVLTGSAFAAYNNLNTFNNTDPNGNWTLFFADLSAGDTSTLTGFSIGITAVPEPVNVALAIFGGLLAAWSLARWRRNAVSAAASN
jgi:subtilisin-like proprotein convertase family protein